MSLIIDYDAQVHDNEILSYTVDLKNKKITLYTEYDDSRTIHEETTIEFTNVNAHHFEDEIECSIILSIEKFGLDDFINDNKELLQQEKSYCWPMFYENELLEKLTNKKQMYFVVSSACGLCGWVLAEDIKITVNEIK